MAGFGLGVCLELLGLAIKIILNVLCLVVFGDKYNNYYTFITCYSLFFISLLAGRTIWITKTIKNLLS